VAALPVLDDQGVDLNVSVKLSQMGLGLGQTVARDNLAHVLVAAAGVSGLRSATAGTAAGNEGLSVISISSRGNAHSIQRGTYKDGVIPCKQLGDSYIWHIPMAKVISLPPHKLKR